MFWNTFINQSMGELLQPTWYALQRITLKFFVVVIFIWVSHRANSSVLPLLLVAGISVSTTVSYDLCTWYFHGLKQRNKFATQLIHTTSCDVVFVVLVLRTFHAYSHRFVGLNNKNIFRLLLSNCATGFPVLMTLKSTKHCCWHLNFQLLRAFFITRFKSSSSGSIKIPRNLLAFSSFGFSIAHFFVSMHQTYASTYKAAQCRVLRSFVSTSVSPRTM